MEYGAGVFLALLLSVSFPGRSWLSARYHQRQQALVKSRRTAISALVLQEPGDLDYAAVALLATVSAVLQFLVGDDGLMLERVPDLELLHYMQVCGGLPSMQARCAV